MRNGVSGKLLATLSSLIVLMVSNPGHAHHGFTNHFDPDQERAIEGIVTKFEFINPHVKIYLRVQSEDGQTDSWVVETSGSSGFLRNGRMSHDSLKAGDHIRIVGHPARVSEHEMRANHIVLPNGDELRMNNPYTTFPFQQNNAGAESGETTR